MRSAHTILFVACLGVCPFASADELWDNYASPDAWDGVTGLSSERDTLISDTWVVDDAVFDTPVIVEQIQWIGFQDLVGSGFTGADFIIMDSDFNVLMEMSDVAYDERLLGEQIFGIEIYEGTTTVPSLPLDPGQYYFGTRLSGGLLGRNYAATSFTGADLIRGNTEAYFRGTFFGFDDWAPVSEVLTSRIPSDFAYRINGIIVPAPASLTLLTLGAALASVGVGSSQHPHQHPVVWLGWQGIAAQSGGHATRPGWAKNSSFHAVDTRFTGETPARFPNLATPTQAGVAGIRNARPDRTHLQRTQLLRRRPRTPARMGPQNRSCPAMGNRQSRDRRGHAKAPDHPQCDDPRSP